MAVKPREVKNHRNADGILTGKPGTVYDVNLKYKTPTGIKTYSKKGFATQTLAKKHEAEMKIKLSNPAFIPAVTAQGKQTVEEYLRGWIESYGEKNLRPATLRGYKSNIENHIIPLIGHLKINEVTPPIVDDMLNKLFDRGYVQNTVRYTCSTLNIAMEHARKYHYIEYNPVRDTTTKFTGRGEIPPPYTVKQVQQLMSNIVGTKWEMPVILGGLYGMRRNEILGLRLSNIDLDKNVFGVVEQLPFKLPKGTHIVKEMAPPKSLSRILPITKETRSFFIRHFAIIEEQKRLAELSGKPYYDNKLLVAQPDGTPINPSIVSKGWAQLLRRLEMPHMRFHDLRHTAATNLHELTGDFFTVGDILGQSLKGIGQELHISGNLEAVTERYINVRLKRKEEVLEKYHSEVFLQEKKEDTTKKEKGKVIEIGL